jgi:hypothetical protein
MIEKCYSEFSSNNFFGPKLKFFQMMPEVLFLKQFLEFEF